MSSHSLDVLTALSGAVPADLARLAELAAGWGPGQSPVEPRLAASVVLCRDGPGGLETYLLFRHARMAFAASTVVFPGGGVDVCDRSDRGSVPDAPLACAVRETREETGVELDPAELLPWAHWITPVIQPIRYDTYFYLAALPPGQSAGDLSTETERAEWTRPAAAVAACEAGTMAMMPPTLSILIELVTLSSVTDALDHGRDRVIDTVLPGVVRDMGGASASGWVYRYPGPPRTVA